jgi:hypothetical protein
MCISNIKEVGYAKQDIVCYKVYEDTFFIAKKPKDKNGIPEDYEYTPGERIYNTPFRGAILHKDQLLGKQDIVPKVSFSEMRHNSENILDELHGRVIIEEGFVHAYLSKSDMHKDFKNFYSDLSHPFLAFKCVIPKGTLYAIGSFDGNDSVKSIAAEKMRIESVDNVLASYEDYESYAEEMYSDEHLQAPSIFRTYTYID